MGYILGIESSCDDTAAAVLRDGEVRSNVVNSQLIHREFGGVVPELASRQHQLWIAKVVAEACEQAGIQASSLEAIAYTQGPGLIGALHVGAAFAKALALGLGIPSVPVNHLEGHLASVFLQDPKPEFPVGILTVSGGHTQIAVMWEPGDIEVLGSTLDDAAGEAFDKIGKLMGLPYPAGPHIDRLAQDGNPTKYIFPTPSMTGWNFSFSGLKTAFLYFLRRSEKENDFHLESEIPHLAASVQHSIVNYLLHQFFGAMEQHPAVRNLAIVGGVSANRELRKRFLQRCNQLGLVGCIPSFAFCTDNAAMIAYAGWQKLTKGFIEDPYTQPFASA